MSCNLWFATDLHIGHILEWKKNADLAQDKVVAIKAHPYTLHSLYHDLIGHAKEYVDMPNYPEGQTIVGIRILNDLSNNRGFDVKSYQVRAIHASGLEQTMGTFTHKLLVENVKQVTVSQSPLDKIREKWGLWKHA